MIREDTERSRPETGRWWARQEANVNGRGGYRPSLSGQLLNHWVARCGGRPEINGERVPMRRKLFGVVLPVVLGLSFVIPAESASAAPAHAAAAHSAAAHITGTSQFLTALEEARNAGVGVAAAGALTGICWSGTALCWRDMPSGAIDMWNRDIRGDLRQQWVVLYEGDMQTTGCAPFVPANYGVYAFLGFNGSFASAGYTNNGGQSYYVGDGSSYDFWAWDPNGVLINCADTRSNNNAPWAYDIPYVSWHAGQQLYTASTGFGDAFQQVHVSP